MLDKTGEQAFPETGSNKNQDLIVLVFVKGQRFTDHLEEWLVVPSTNLPFTGE